MAKKSRKTRTVRGRKFQRRGNIVERVITLGIGVLGGYVASNKIAPSFGNFGILAPAGVIGVSELFLGSLPPGIQSGVTAGAALSAARQGASMLQMKEVMNLLAGDDLPVITEADFAAAVDEANRRRMGGDIFNPMGGDIFNPMGGDAYEVQDDISPSVGRTEYQYN